MALPLLPGGIRVAMEFDYRGKVVANIYHVVTTDPIITVHLEQVAGVFRSWWVNDLSPSLTDKASLLQVSAHDISVANGEKVYVVSSPPDPGGNPDSTQSSQVALVVSHKTNKTGRSFQGRTYLFSIPQTALTGNDVSAAKRATILAAYPLLVTDLATLNSELVVASFYSGGVPRGVAVGTPITSFSVGERVDTQRRRLPVE